MSIVWNAFSKWYFGKLTARLSRTGLTFHDAVAETGVFEKGISRLPESMQAERTLRMKRALDLSQKHVDLPASAAENPWREYKQVAEVLGETQKEHDERMFMSGRWWMPYHIGRENWFAYDTKSAWFWQPKSTHVVPGKKL